MEYISKKVAAYGQFVLVYLSFAYPQYSYGTLCPGSSDPPEKNIKYICIRKWGLHHLLTITIL